MATQGSTTHTLSITLVVVTTVAAGYPVHEATDQVSPVPIWRDPAWSTTIDDTTLGEAD